MKEDIHWQIDIIGELYLTRYDQEWSIEVYQSHTNSTFESKIDRIDLSNLHKKVEYESMAILMCNSEDQTEEYTHEFWVPKITPNNIMRAALLVAIEFGGKL